MRYEIRRWNGQRYYMAWLDCLKDYIYYWGHCFLGHDPKLTYGLNVGDKYITCYDCSCGKRVKFDETVIKIPYMIMRKKFREA